MRTRTAACAALLALSALTAGCGESQEEIAEECRTALASTAVAVDVEDVRPEACEGLSQDDYEALVISQGPRDSRDIDENGDIDLGEQLEDE
ncbi:hypothetical protein ACWCPM_07720 [Streptomyces sp. NPDC002309]